MVENSKISWTDHTYNPWRGCTKVSSGCTNCYAETMSKRNPAVLGEWGPHGTRVRGADSYLRKPLAWNKQEWWECLDCGYRGNVHTFDDYCPECRGGNCKPTRQRVFCASLADVFEDRPELVEWRRDLVVMMEKTPNLDWLLLTKRPENVSRMITEAITINPSAWWMAMRNVWIGTSVENQETADKRIPELLKVPAKVRFLSMEPLLGPVNLPMIESYLQPDGFGMNGPFVPHGIGYADDPDNLIDWVIVGGESGHNARPMHPDWARSIRDQCQAAGVAFHFKQWGEWRPADKWERTPGNVAAKDIGRFWKKEQGEPTSEVMVKVGKSAAGRELDGRIWNEYPKAVTP